MNIVKCVYRLIGNSNYHSSSCGFLDQLPFDDKWKMISTAVVGGGILALPALYYLQKSYFASKKTLKERMVEKPLKITVVANGNHLRRFGDIGLACQILELIKKICSSATVEMITNKVEEACQFVPENLWNIIKPIETEIKADDSRHLLINIKNGIGSLRQKKIGDVWKIKNVGDQFKYNHSRNTQVTKMPMGSQFITKIIFNEELYAFANSSKDPASKAVCLLGVKDLYLRDQLQIDEIIQVDEIKKDVNPNSFYKYENSLYFGYPFSATAALDFILSVCAKEKDSNKGIDIVLVGDQMNKKTLNTRTLLETFENYKKKDFKEFPMGKGFNIDRVEVFSSNRSLIFPDLKRKTKEEKENEDDNRSKTLRIILPGNISHHDVIQLLKASEDYVCVSGVNSLAEALSAHKMISLELREHMKDFYEQLIAMKGGKVFRDLMVGKSDQKDFEKIGKYLNNVNVQTAFNDLAEALYRNNNFGSFLEKQLENFVKTQPSEMKS